MKSNNMEVKTPDDIFHNINSIKNNIIKTLWIDCACYNEQFESYENDADEYDKNVTYVVNSDKGEYLEDTFENILNLKS